MPLAITVLGPLFSRGEHGSMHINLPYLSVGCVHEGETGIGESWQAMIQKYWKTVLHPVWTGNSTHHAFTGSAAQWANQLVLIPSIFY